jgi:hypothetical protein
MTQRVNVLCIRDSDGRISQLSGNELNIRRIFGDALPVFAREEASTSFLARFVPPARRENFITTYEAIGEIRQFAQKNNLKLWLDPQCDFDGNLIEDSGIKGEPGKIAGIVLKL